MMRRIRRATEIFATAKPKIPLDVVSLGRNLENISGAACDGTIEKTHPKPFVLRLGSQKVSFLGSRIAAQRVRIQYEKKAYQGCVIQLYFTA